MFFKTIPKHQLQPEQYKPWLPDFSTSLRSHILNQYNLLPHPFPSSLFVDQMGMQHLLYNISTSFLTKLNQAYYGQFLTHKILPLSFSSSCISFSTKCSYFLCVSVM